LQKDTGCGRWRPVKYDYDNNLYIVAGEIIARVSGTTWEQFVEKRILQPLEMTESATSFVRLKDTSNIIAAHALVNGKVQVIERTKGELMNAAGGIYSSVSDLSKWVMMQMNKGSYGPDKKARLISKKIQQDLWTPQTLMGVGTAPSYNSHFTAYGLGFRLADVKGYLEVSHTGGLAGMVTQITMYPELNLGVTGMDWVKLMAEREKKGIDDAAKITGQVWADIAKQQASGTGFKPDPEQYTGTYRDPWFGDVFIELKEGRLWFRSKRSPGLTGELIYYKGQTFIAKWNDHSLDADAFVLFQTGYDGKAAGITVKPISPLTDFSYDFQDLEFERVKDGK